MPSPFDKVAYLMVKLLSTASHSLSVSVPEITAGSSHQASIFHHSGLVPPKIPLLLPSGLSPW